MCRSHSLITFAVLASLPLCASATTPPKPPKPSHPAPTPIKNTSSSTSSADARAAAQATSNSISGAKSSAISGDSTSESNNSLNISDQSTTLYEGDPRVLPPVVLPSVFPAIGCGRGLAVGGTGLTAGAAISYSWSDKDCEVVAQHLSLAQSFYAIGQPVLACEVLVVSPLARKIFPEGVECVVARKEEVTTIDTSKFATKEEVEIMWRKANQK